MNKRVEKLFKKVDKKTKDYVEKNVSESKYEKWLEYYLANKDYYKNISLKNVCKDFNRKPKDVGIYRIVNLETNKSYIGLSRSLANRKYNHFAELRGNRHPKKDLQSDYNKLGEDYFSFEVLENCNPAELEKKEIYYHELYLKKGIPTYSDSYVTIPIPACLAGKVQSWIDEYNANRPK